jgi:hypothetical protein
MRWDLLKSWFFGALAAFIGGFIDGFTVGFALGGTVSLGGTALSRATPDASGAAHAISLHSKIEWFGIHVLVACLANAVHDVGVFKKANPFPNLYPMPTDGAPPH